MSKTVCFITRNFGKYDPDSLKGYESIGGFRALRKALTMEGCDIADVLAANGVQGRGGAAYDMGKKWRQAREVPGAHKCVCATPTRASRAPSGSGAAHPRPLPTAGGHDHRRLGRGADNGYIYLREEYSHLRPRLLSAIAQCEAAGHLGENILGSGLNYRIHLYSGAGAYVCGEGSALAESIGGHAGRPRMKPPFIKQCGVFHLPTCVNNVESLSLVAPLLLDDEGYYKSQGTPDCPGTKMISVCGNVKRPGVFEVPFGITIREIVYDLAGGMESEDYPLRLVQLGGASGRICSPAQLDTPYTYKGMRQADLTAIGSGAVLVVDERTSVIGFLRMTQEFFSHESCGQCTPCREGNRHISLLLDKVAEGTHTAQDIATLKKFADIMSSASLCGLGETAQSALLSCMKRFPEVFAVKEEVAVR
ncbi:NADH-ubiquinone oxidoreductase-F iron-sulfur binding region domain-containing protein [Evtepia sp.]|uniref:NADH-ubiquinone oxidoreductase-F iron-sulfur binding region domain-containing protein n=1 Tax=Evtepia sp. TaxID=2773933 RepID=UPI0039995368